MKSDSFSAFFFAILASITDFAVGGKKPIDGVAVVGVGIVISLFFSGFDQKDDQLFFHNFQVFPSL